MKTILSGIQPSGNLTIGNYTGALRQWVELQSTYQSYFMVVDLHAITVPQDPNVLHAKVIEIAKLYLAAGIDPKKSTMFIQSHVPAHAELGWILGTLTKFSELERMTQYKDKAVRHAKSLNAGLFNYPSLMAADILLYQTDVVPVGEDQTQHLELTRTLARRFNDQFGGTFKVPEAYIPKVGARIMGLDDPAAKMSKSSAAPYHALKLLDDAKTVETKIKKAVTDSGSDIRHGEDKPAVTNLLTIFSLVSGQSIAALEKQYNGKGYADFKRDLAAAVNAFLAPIQKMYKDISDEEVLSVLHDGAEKANLAAEKTMKTVRERIGFVQ